MTCGKCNQPCKVVERPHLPNEAMRRRSDCCSAWIKEDFEVKRDS